MTESLQAALVAFLAAGFYAAICWACFIVGAARERWKWVLVIREQQWGD